MGNRNKKCFFYGVFFKKNNNDLQTITHKTNVILVDQLNAKTLKVYYSLFRDSVLHLEGTWQQ